MSKQYPGFGQQALPEPFALPIPENTCGDHDEPFPYGSRGGVFLTHREKRELISHYPRMHADEMRG